jgi:hypothetical protein
MVTSPFNWSVSVCDNTIHEDVQCTFLQVYVQFNTRIRIRIRNTDTNPTTQVNHTDGSATRDKTTNIKARATCIRVKVHNLV